MFKRELKRKSIHTLFGILFIGLSFYLNQSEIIIFSSLLTLISIFNKFYLKKFNVLYRFGKFSLGTILYPFAMAILAFIWLPDFQDVFIFSIVILAFSDTVAALVGSYKIKKIPFFQKTFWGSMAFFITTTIISILLFKKIDILPILLSSLLLTIIEFIFIYGLDNLVIPLTASYLFYNFNY